MQAMPGQLNAFQLSMLQWNDLHPYNAVHVVRIAEPLDLRRLQSAIDQTLEGMGLTGLLIDRRAASYRYDGGAAGAEIRLAGTDTRSAWGCEEEIERQLNTPFASDGSFSPFRFFVTTAAGAFSLGLVYFHPVADALSIVPMLKEIVDAYREPRAPSRAVTVDRYPRRWAASLYRRPSALAAKLASLPGSIRQMRSTCRPAYRDAGDMNNKFVCFSLDQPILAGIIRAAKDWNVTLNDLFLALLLQGLARLATDRAGAGRRRNLALGCIVNTRRDLGLEGKPVFGMFLGSFVVHHAVPAQIQLPDLARAVARQTRAIKQKRLYLGSSLELTFGRLMMALFAERRRKRLYQKHYPLWGGITNMNLNALWPQPEQSRPVDYLRAVSTGPVTPLVASISTIGHVASIGLSYRTTVFVAPDIGRVIAAFVNPPGVLGRP